MDRQWVPTGGGFRRQNVAAKRNASVGSAASRPAATGTKILWIAVGPNGSPFRTKNHFFFFFAVERPPRTRLCQYNISLILFFLNQSQIPDVKLMTVPNDDTVTVC